ncbi:MAG TPA: hypothetical protein PKA64_21145, partial [Myxococcota bacterium]|nr:hypothetical protein [Myxococcota bacterium]
RPRARHATDLRIWHETGSKARAWSEARLPAVRDQLVTDAADTREGGRPSHRDLLAWMLGVTPAHHGYDRHTLEGHAPDRIRLVLVLRRDPSAWEPDDDEGDQDILGERKGTPEERLTGPRRALPGEHGYRFFPSFYRNVFDTMGRIPVLRSARRAAGLPADPVFDVYRTVLDNVRPVERHTFAFPGDRAPIDIDRRPNRSLRDALAAWRVFQRGLGFSLRDIALYQARLLRFLTSGESRRREAEQVTWDAWVEADRFEPGFREAISQWSLALGGLRGDEADARTFGTTALQFVLDQLERRPVVDGTLNGPTSQAWFEPWRRRLAQAGQAPVRFHADQVERLELVGGEIRVVCRNGLGYEDGDGFAPFLPVGAQVVIATQPHEAWRLIRGLALRSDDVSRREGVRRFHTMLDDEGTFTPAQLIKARPDCALRHFTGVQFFLPAHTHVASGHIYLPESAWGLTAVGQSQFRASRESDYHGVLSVDVGVTWAAGDDGRSFWGSPRAEIARHIWDELRDAVRGGPAELPRELPTWAIDGGLSWGEPSPEEAPWLFDASRLDTAWLLDPDPDRSPLLDEPPRYDNNPYFMSLAGRFDRRPGRVDRDDPTAGYEPVTHNLWVAGAYAQTFTRVVTMEAACESGRHAVNGILRQARAQGRYMGELCPVFDPEGLEPSDLAYWKELDERLHAAGLPHLLEILRVEAWLAELLPASPTPRQEATLTERLDRITAVFEPGGDG